LPPAGNRFLFFFLIVCTFALLCAWKTGLLLWIPGLYAIEGILRAWGARPATEGWIKAVEIKKIDSSTRSSVRKSGKLAEMLEAEKVGVVQDF
jgi:hypothetical protein